MPFEFFKRLQLSQAQTFGIHPAPGTKKSLTAQQFISKGPQRPMHIQRPEHEEKMSAIRTMNIELTQLQDLQNLIK